MHIVQIGVNISIEPGFGFGYIFNAFPQKTKRVAGGFGHQQRTIGSKVARSDMINIFEHKLHITYIVFIQYIGIINAEFFKFPVEIHSRCVGYCGRILIQNKVISPTISQHMHHNTRISKN